MFTTKQYGKALIVGLIVSAIILGLALYFVYSSQTGQEDQTPMTQDEKVVVSEEASTIPELPKVEKSPEGLDDTSVKELDDLMNSIDASTDKDDLSDIAL